VKRADELANPASDDGRRAELAENLLAVRQRIEAACAAANRAIDDVHLIAVTKTFPASDVMLLASLGLRDFGENRDQEAAAKVLATQANPSFHWHFVGALQTNKCASVASYATLIHSVDRLRLVGALGQVGVARQAEQQAPIRCLVQIDVDDVSRPGRGGARPDDVPALSAAVAAHPGLLLAGVMAVAPVRMRPRDAFGRLAVLADAVRQRHPEAVIISAGMSTDLDDAVANGATHLRVGTALLGFRRHPVG
jgi:pyridoxal phosphate enzyme (YggS family)